MCHEHKSHNLEGGKSITVCVKKVRGTVPEDLLHGAKITAASEVPEGDLSCMVTAKAH